MAQPSTTATPAPAATVPPAATATPAPAEPKVTADDFVTGFLKALGTKPVTASDELVSMYVALGGQRERASSLAMKAAIAAGHAAIMGPLVSTLDERLAATVTSKRTQPKVSPAQVYAAGIVALDRAISALPIPEGLSVEEANKIKSAVLDDRSPDGGVEGLVADRITEAAKRAISAVSRGGSINRGPSTARKTGSGTAADHVASAVKTVKVGETVTVADIVKHESSVYGAGDDHRPSPGAIRDALAKKDGSVRSGATWIGVPNETAGQPVIGAKRTK